MKFDKNDPYVFTQMEAHIAYLESEVDILNECLKEANKTISQLESKLNTREYDRKQVERELRQKIRMEECNHVWLQKTGLTHASTSVNVLNVERLKHSTNVTR